MSEPIATQLNSIVASYRPTSLVPSKHQPRSLFDEQELDQLAESLKTTGVIEPLIVRRLDNSEQYEILSGERRWRAAQKAGLDAVPCRLHSGDESAAAKLAFEANLNRADLSPIELARVYQRAIKDRWYGKGAKALAAHLGISESTLSNQMAVLKLPERWQDFLGRGLYGLSATHSRPLLQWSHRPQVLDLVAEWLIGSAERVTVEHLSQLCGEAVQRVSRLAEPGEMARIPEEGVVEICLTDADIADPAMQIETIDGVRRAFNVSLWSERNGQRLVERETAGARHQTPPKATQEDAERCDQEPQSRSKKSKKSSCVETVAETAARLRGDRQLFPDDDQDAGPKRLKAIIATFLHRAILLEIPEATDSELLALLAALCMLDVDAESARAFWKDALRKTRSTRPADMIVRSWATPEQRLGLRNWLDDLIGMYEPTDRSLGEWMDLADCLGATGEAAWVCSEWFLEQLSLSQLQSLAKEWKRATQKTKAKQIETLLSLTGGLRKYPSLLSTIEDAARAEVRR